MTMTPPQLMSSALLALFGEAALAQSAVAAQHAGQPDALEKVSARIKSGGSGIYGPVPMPEQAPLKDDELKLLAGWNLAGAPDQ